MIDISKKIDYGKELMPVYIESMEASLTGALDSLKKKATDVIGTPSGDDTKKQKTLMEEEL